MCALHPPLKIGSGIWILSLGKLGPVDIWQSVIVGVNYIWHPKICKLAIVNDVCIHVIYFLEQSNWCHNMPYALQLGPCFASEHVQTLFFEEAIVHT